MFQSSNQIFDRGEKKKKTSFFRICVESVLIVNTKQLSDQFFETLEQIFIPSVRLKSHRVTSTHIYKARLTQNIFSPPRKEFYQRTIKIENRKITIYPEKFILQFQLPAGNK